MHQLLTVRVNQKQNFFTFAALAADHLRIQRGSTTELINHGCSRGVLLVLQLAERSKMAAAGADHARGCIATPHNLTNTKLANIKQLQASNNNQYKNYNDKHLQ